MILIWSLHTFINLYSLWLYGFWLSFLSKQKDTGQCDWTDLFASALLRFTWLELWGARMETCGTGREETTILFTQCSTHTHTHTQHARTDTYKCLGHIQPHSPPNWLPIINAGSLCSCFLQRNTLLHVAIYWQQYNSLIWSCFIK